MQKRDTGGTERCWEYVLALALQPSTKSKEQLQPFQQQTQKYLLIVSVANLLSSDRESSTSSLAATALALRHRCTVLWIKGAPRENIYGAVCEN